MSCTHERLKGVIPGDEPIMRVENENMMYQVFFCGICKCLYMEEGVNIGPPEAKEADPPAEESDHPNNKPSGIITPKKPKSGIIVP